MGLKLKLKPGEIAFIAGALIRNAGNGTVLELMNEVPMLRGKDILLAQDAKSPCQKLYLIAQSMYFDSDDRLELIISFEAMVKEIIRAAPSIEEKLKSAVEHVGEERFYAALKDLQSLIAYESELIAYAKESK